MSKNEGRRRTLRTLGAQTSGSSGVPEPGSGPERLLIASPIGLCKRNKLKKSHRRQNRRRRDFETERLFFPSNHCIEFPTQYKMSVDTLDICIVRCGLDRSILMALCEGERRRTTAMAAKLDIFKDLFVARAPNWMRKGICCMALATVLTGCQMSLPSVPNPFSDSTPTSVSARDPGSRPQDAAKPKRLASRNSPTSRFRPTPRLTWTIYWFWAPRMVGSDALPWTRATNGLRDDRDVRLL